MIRRKRRNPSRKGYLKTPKPIYIDNPGDAAYWSAYFAEADCIAIDTETTGVRNVKDRVKFFSLSDGKERICVPAEYLDFFSPCMENEETQKRFTNAKFDMHMLANEGITIGGFIYDTVILDWLLDEDTRQGQHGLKQCALDYLNLQMTPFKKVFGAVGSTKKEIQTMCDFHTALANKDETHAMELLARIKAIEIDADMLTVLRRLSRNKYTLSGKEVVRLARKCKMVEHTRTRNGVVKDFASIISLNIGDADDKQVRIDNLHIIEDEDYVIKAHKAVMKFVVSQCSNIDPLQLIMERIRDYASLDAYATYKLTDVLLNKLEDEVIPQLSTKLRDYTLVDYYRTYMEPLIHVVWNMEREGVLIDDSGLEEVRLEVQDRIDELQREMVKIAGGDINVNSTHQLRDYFYYYEQRVGQWFDIFDNDPKIWTPGGKNGRPLPSTNVKAIEYFSTKGEPLAKCLIEYRKLTKVVGYLNGLPEYLDRNARIHPSYNITGTLTGRFSCKDPNLQNIPARGELGSKMRKLFVAPKGKALIVADYEQLEMRIMAHMSQEPEMIEAINKGKDLHSMTAALAAGYDYDAIVKAKKADNPTKEQKGLLEIRSQMKAVGFGLLYGIGSGKLAGQLGLPVQERRASQGFTFETSKEAQQLIDTYFRIYPSVKEFIDDTKDFAKRSMYVQTLTGRYRRLSNVLSPERGLRALALRQSVNSIIQGTAADICNAGMINCFYDDRLNEMGVKLLLQIHDELVFECPTEYVDEAMECILNCMEDPYELDVPLKCSIDAAKSWGDAK